MYHNFGTVWQKGGTLYYFDEMGPSQLISNPIYQILDPVAADFLLRSQETRQITADDIRKLIRGGAGGAAVRDRAGGQDALPQDLLDFLG